MRTQQTWRRWTPIVAALGCAPIDMPEDEAVTDNDGAELAAATWSAAPDLDPAEDTVEVALRAAPFAWDPGTGTPLSGGLAFNGSVPGPLIEVVRGQMLRVRFTNNTSMPLTLHWHGLRVPDEMDGILQMEHPVQPGGTFVYEFPVIDAGLYWYHPHMSSSDMLEAGLYGAIRVREPEERAADVDLPVVLDDLLLDRDNQIDVPGTPHEQVMGRLGGLLLLNGKSGRTISVNAGQDLLLRLVNAANARTFDLTLEGHQLEVVGTDGGWLASPIPVEHLTLSPGERYLVRARLNGAPGASYRLMNGRFRLHEQDDEHSMMEIDPLGNDPTPLATFIYAEAASTGAGFAPPASDTPSFDATSLPQPSHRWVLAEDMMAGTVTLDGASWPDVPMVQAPGSQITVFEVENRSEMHHPFHIHGNRFQVLSVDGTPFAGGWKDTWDVPPRAIVTVVSELDNPGMWMVHCHILEHADRGMAGMLSVTPREGAALTDEHQ